MRARLASVALLVGGCRLVAPFDLDDLPGQAVDGDADGDADDEAATDGDPPLDAESDVDGAAWEPLAGCTGVASAERWIVAAAGDGTPGAYLTGRDCADPRLLCRDCYGTAISPAGDRALVAFPAGDEWRLDDRIAIVDLEDDGFPITPLGVRGANPVWLDDECILYVAAAEGVTEPCEDTAPPERTSLRIHEIETGADEAIGDSVGRAWKGGFPAPAPSLGLVAFGHDLAANCDRFHVAIAIRSREPAPDIVLDWTTSWLDYFPVGVLPEESGFLVQYVVDRSAGRSRLYAVSFEGEGAVLFETVTTTSEGSLPGSLAPGHWPGCASVRRLGPACELYCQEDHSARWLRLALAEGRAETVSCTGLGADYRIMDVWQR